MCDRCGETPCLRHCPCTLFHTCLHHRPDYNCGYVGMEQVEAMEREGWESEEAMRAVLALKGVKLSTPMGNTQMKRAVVLGAGGFIGGHLVSRLKRDGLWVRGVDIRRHQHRETEADEFLVADLRDPGSVRLAIDDSIDEVYQLAADMGGAAFVFTGENDAAIMHNSCMINLNVCEVCVQRPRVKRVLYSSSACMYPEHNQLDPQNPNCAEDSAYPANPDSEYGWEKLFSERLYLAYHRNHGLDVRIARFHNVFGPLGEWEGGREKAPAAMCRKVAQAPPGGAVEVWGDGQQTRSFLHVDECVEGICRLMASDTFRGPVNIGSDEMVSINELARMVIDISGKEGLRLENLPAVQKIGVRGRNSDNRLIERELGWRPRAALRDGMETTYRWVREQVEAARKK